MQAIADRAWLGTLRVNSAAAQFAIGSSAHDRGGRFRSSLQVQQLSMEGSRKDRDQMSTNKRGETPKSGPSLRA